MSKQKTELEIMQSIKSGEYIKQWKDDVIDYIESLLSADQGLLLPPKEPT